MEMIKRLVREYEPYDEMTDMSVHEEEFEGEVGFGGVGTRKVQILQSAAGFYIGSLYEEKRMGGGWFPYDRESNEYWSSREKAEEAFKTGNYTYKF